MRYNGTASPIVQTEERFTGYRWVPIEEVKDMEILFDLASIVYKNKTYFI